MSRSFVLFHSLSVKDVFRGRDTFNIINWKRVGATMFKHVTVLLKGNSRRLRYKARWYICRLYTGGGGHSSYLLSQLTEGGKLIAFDQDEIAIQNAKEKFFIR